MIVWYAFGINSVPLESGELTKMIRDLNVMNVCVFWGKSHPLLRQVNLPERRVFMNVGSRGHVGKGAYIASAEEKD